jgi:hypothetical protein
MCGDVGSDRSDGYSQRGGSGQTEADSQRELEGVEMFTGLRKRLHLNRKVEKTLLATGTVIVDEQLKSDVKKVLELIRQDTGHIGVIPEVTLKQMFALSIMRQGDEANLRLKKALMLLNGKASVYWNGNGSDVAFRRSILFGCGDCLHRTRKNDGQPVCAKTLVSLQTVWKNNCGFACHRDLLEVFGD